MTWHRFTQRRNAGVRNSRPARLLTKLPPYQIALWPDGWQLEADGRVRLRDTHAIAEARRWYATADERGAIHRSEKTLRALGMYIPRSVIALSGRLFGSELAASVAVQLVAGAWVSERRRQLLSAPHTALAEQQGCWTGSRHRGPLPIVEIKKVLCQLIAICVAEDLIPRLAYGVEVRKNDSFGVPALLTSVHAPLVPHQIGPVRETLMTALIPWNRAMALKGATTFAIGVEVRRG